MRPFLRFLPRYSMVGLRPLPPLSLRLRCLLRFAVLATCCACGVGLGTSSTAHAATMRLRIEWGGGTPCTWRGQAALSEGTLSQPRTLGVETDEPGSMWCAGGALQIQPPTPRSYDGLDITVDAPLEATLHLELAADSASPVVLDVSLASLLEVPLNKQLDDRGNRVSIRRAPGDSLQVRVKSPSLVFTSGDLLDLEIVPNLLADVSGGVRLTSRLVKVSSQREVWSDSVHLPSPDPAAEPVQLARKLPAEEGVYDLIIEASRRSITNPISWKSVIAQRKVQLVVLSPDPPERPLIGEAPPMEVLEELDFSTSAWWDRLSSLPLVPGLRRKLGDGSASIQSHDLGSVVRLGPGARAPDMSWEAYPLPVSRPGYPHVVEVEVPAGEVQTLGISIVEPDAAGAVLPIGLDSGIHQRPASLGQRGTQSIVVHRLICWPRTTSPLVLLTNRQPGTLPIYGKIRLLGPRSSMLTTNMLGPIGLESHVPPQLPRLAPPEPADGARRLLAAYYDRPLFPENFSARQAVDDWPGGSGRCLDDWTTFYEGASRLIEYLTHVGQNAVLMSVVADGSAIYPSQLLESSPKYDDGIFFASGQDPVRKDVLELLLQMCDREGIRLIPAVQFAAPLPELEALRRQGGAAAEGLELVDPRGKRWLDEHPPRHGLAGYYNPLHPAVQQAMRSVVRELAERYAHHPSYGGVAVQLSAVGYAHLPGLYWGYDQHTLDRFQRDTKLNLAAVGGSRPASEVLLSSQEYRKLWTAWRCDTMFNFYRELAQVATGGRSDKQLYLATAHLFERSDLQQQLQPRLAAKPDWDELLLGMGLNSAQLSAADGIVLLRPNRVTPNLPLQSGSERLVNQSAELDERLASRQMPSMLSFHEPQLAALPGFDAKSPFSPTYTRLVSQFAPAGAENRRRFAHAMATLDARAIFDGGWLLPLGQEDTLRDWQAVYRALPAEPFKTLDMPCPPVVVRTLQKDDRTYVYLVNDSPWPVTLSMNVLAGPNCQLEPLGGTRAGALELSNSGRHRWSLELPAYALAGATLSGADVRFEQPRVALPADVMPALSTRVQELWSRAAALQDPQPLEILRNAGFESSSESLEGWTFEGAASASASIDAAAAHTGRHCAQLEVGQAPAWLASEYFEVPTTGRLAVAVWMRTAEGATAPKLRLAVEGQMGEEPFYRYTVVGAAGSTLPPLRGDWSEYVFQVRDLPSDLRRVRVRFDLLDAGQVWVDDVRLSSLAFSDTERLELSKTITLAEYKLQRGELGDCLRLLEGYWPSFLVQHVEPASAVATVEPPNKSAEAEPAKESPAATTGMLDRLKGMLPSFWR